MDESIVRYLSGRCDAAEAAALEAWRAESEENEAYFSATARAWALSGVEVHEDALRPPALVALIRAPEDESADRVGAGTAKARRWPDRTIAWTTAAAAALACVALGIHYLASGSIAPTAQQVFEATEAGEHTVALDDGSWVRLAPGARLEVRSVAQTRRVELRGRAFFAVAPDARRPFVVGTYLGTARVLGTRFEVQDGEEELRVIVVEGRVSVTAGDDTELVTAGSVAYAPGGRDLRVERVDSLYSLLEWESGLLLFQATPLSDVVAEVARWSGRTVVVRDSTLAGRQVTAAFEGDPFEEVMAVLCEVVVATCEIGSDVTIVGTQGREP